MLFHLTLHQQIQSPQLIMISKHTMKLIILTLSILSDLFSPVTAVAAEEVRILFVGNSYTGGIRGTFSKLVAAAPEGSAVKIEYISPGGKNLESHLKNPSITKKIMDGKWNFVVLQDQSQTPAVFPDKFKNAAIGLDKLIDASGAKTVFYQTWGRRDGDKMNIKRFPDYKSMQDVLSKNYTSVANQCDAMLAPVGDTWAQVMKANLNLGKSLYAGDGSHPSAKGAYLAACVFYATIFAKDPGTIQYDSNIPKQEMATIQRAARETVGIVEKSVYPINYPLTNNSGNQIKAMITGKSKTHLYFKSRAKNHVFKIDQLSEQSQKYVATLPVNK